MTDILEQEIGLTYGLINEKNNQILEERNREEVVEGNANMLMNSMK